MSILDQMSSAMVSTTENKTNINKSQDKNDEEKLFLYFLKQRWFFFENKEMFFYDKWSGFLWANLDYYEASKYTKSEGEKVTKNIKWHNIDGWEIPSLNNLKNFLSGNRVSWFDIKSKNNIIDEKDAWLTKESIYDIENSRTSSSTNDYYKSFLLPCNKTFSSTKLKNSSEDKFINKEYEISQIKKIIDIFVEQDFIPKFYEAEYATLYNKYVNKLKNKDTSLVEKEETVEQELIEIPVNTGGNLKDLFANINIKQVDSSPIKFYQITIAMVEQLLKHIDEFQHNNPELMSSVRNLAGLKEFNQSDLKLNEEEQDFINSEFKHIDAIFDFEFNKEKEFLFNLLAEANNILQETAMSNNPSKPLDFLANIETIKRPSFTFLIEYTGKIIEAKVQKIKWFNTKSKEITKISAELISYLGQYQTFTTSEFHTFEKKLLEDSIDQEKIVVWFAKWREERFIIMQKLFNLLKLIEQDLKLPTEIIIRVLDSLKNYQQEINNFFSKEVVSIHKKYAFQTAGKFQEKFETEIQLANIVSKFSHSIKEIIFDCETINQKILIYRWSSDWFNLHVNEIVSFSKESNIKDLTPEFSKILNKIERLNNENFETYLNDLQSYSEFMKKRDDNFHSLMFKMRKELEKGV
ncbi:hypothetical protein JEZ13_12230 [bacterium]|nr:hypothetical protein [bacterium]